MGGNSEQLETKRHFPWGYVTAPLSLILLGVSVFLLISSSERSKVMGKEVETVSVEIPNGLSRLEVAGRIENELGWERGSAEELASVHAQMDWAEFALPLTEILRERLEWGQDEETSFITNSSSYFTPRFDALSGVYVSGEYSFMSTDSYASVAATIISRVREAGAEDMNGYLSGKLNEEAVSSIADFIDENISLLPDLVPLPPSDMVLEGAGAGTLLRFSTTYYNVGDGPLELQADPDTRSVIGDQERDVFQRIYKTDDTYRDSHVGTFLWHDPHLHYHFADFITYDLEAVEVEGPEPDLKGLLKKSTFCIRDMSHIEIDLENRPADANYQVCGKERQGISVGWADTYFYTYPDQTLVVGDLPPGTYRLTFVVNPEDRFEETTKENNTSSVVFELDVEEGSLEVVRQEPEETPEVTHIYVDDEF
ncbi:MAG: lysyl oxidase family protein [Candidatus Paceibacterota bacterium]